MGVSSGTHARSFGLVAHACLLLSVRPLFLVKLLYKTPVGACTYEGKFMQHSNNIIGSSTIRTCIAIAAFACTLLAGTLTAEVIRTEQPKRGIDPIIHAILDGFESGNLRSGEELTQTRTLKPRSKTKKERVNVGHRNRLLVKFADELKVRITPNGQLVSRTNKSIQTVIEAALSLGVTLSPAAKVEESKVNELIARAEARSGKQMPDIGGVFYVDGSISAVRAAADVFLYHARSRMARYPAPACKRDCSSWSKTTEEKR